MRVKHPDQDRPSRTPFAPLAPILGIVVNLALMSSLDKSNWLRLIVWMVIGQIFGYGRRHSHLRLAQTGRKRFWAPLETAEDCIKIENIRPSGHAYVYS
jgi:amino acid transporter